MAVAECTAAAVAYPAVSHPVAMKGLRNLFGRFLSILSARILTTIIAIISTPIIARLLGPGGYGDYAVILSIFAIYMIPVSGAITEGIQKYVAEYRSEPNWQENVIHFYGIVAVILGCLGSVGLIAFTRVGATEALFGADFVLYFYFLAGFVLVAQFRALFQHTVLGFGLERISGPLEVLQKASMVTIGILLVVSLGIGVEGMLVGHIVANILVGVLAISVILRRVSIAHLLRSTPNSFPYREVVRFNGLNIVLVLMVMSLYHIDVIMLRMLVDSETTGYYKAALSLAEYLWAVPLALQVVLLHSSSTLWSEDRHDDITALASRVTRYTLLFVLLLAIGLATLADIVVPLYYGEPFAVATTPLLLLIPGVIGFAAARPLQAIGQGSGQVKTLVAASGLTAGLNLVLNALLIPQFGMNGAAVATSISYGAMFAAMVWAAWRIGFNPVADIRAPRIVLTGLLSAVPIVLLAAAIQHDILALLVVPPTGFLIYAVFAVITGAIKVTELRNLVRKTPDPLGSIIEAGVLKLQSRLRWPN